MSAAPSYIVYGHRHAVRLVTRLIAIGLLLAAIVTVVAVLTRGGDSGKPAAEAPATPHGGGATTVATAKHTSTTGKAAGAVKNKPPAKHPATKPKSHKPARPIPVPGKTPVMVLNSNGIHGVAHQLAARVQSAGYPITYVGNAQKRGLPTIVQYAKGYGPAARKLARLVGNVQFVTPFDGITPAQAKGAKLVVILGT
jgi:hypothetical protein